MARCHLLQHYNVGRLRSAELPSASAGSRAAVKSYRDLLNQYLLSPRAQIRMVLTASHVIRGHRGVLQRRHIVAAGRSHCGKEFNRKLEPGPVDHDIDARAKVCENGRVAADPETLRQLNEDFSEREVEAGTGVHRSRIRMLRHGGTVTQRTYQQIESFLRTYRSPKATVITFRIADHTDANDGK